MMALPLIVSVTFLPFFLLLLVLSADLHPFFHSLCFPHLLLVHSFPLSLLSYPFFLLSLSLSIYLSVSHTLSSSSPQLSGDNIQNRQMSIDQLQTMQVIRGKRTNLGGEDGNHQGLFHAAPGRPRKADKVS